MFNAKEQAWFIRGPLTLQQREILFITATAAGIEIFGRTRENAEPEEYPHIGYRTKEFGGAGQDMNGFGTMPVDETFARSYDEVIESLRNIIKQSV